MSGRLEVLAFLQESATRLRQMARERPCSISANMIKIADDIARDAARLEAELVDAGLIDQPTANEG